MPETRILIVEDELIVAEDIKSSLEDNGYCIVGPVTSAAEAKKYAREQKPDLVLLDIVLAGEENGIDVAEYVRAELSIPVIFLTAYSDPKTLERAKHAEPYGYLIKPYNERELFSEIEIALYKHRMETRLKHLNAILRAIRNVNQLIVQEKNKGRLVQKACEHLTETGGITWAWIALRGVSGQMGELYSSGIDESKEEFKSALGIEGTVNCLSLTEENDDLQIIEDPKTQCSKCPLSNNIYEEKSSLAARLMHQGRDYGALVVNVAQSMIHDKELPSLIAEVAGDISFALHSIEIDRQKSRFEESLKESERILNDTGSMAKIGGWEHDLATGKATWTKALYDIIEIDYGREPPGVDEHLDFYPEDHRIILEKAYRDSISTGKPFDLELRIRTTSGKTIWCHVHAEAIMQNGECVKMRGTFQDITDNKKAEHDLVSANQQISRQLQENSAILSAAENILKFEDFASTARHIFDECSKLIGSTAGYVALLSPDGSENELLFLQSGDLPCNVDPNLPMPVRGLRAEAYRTGRVVYENAFMESEWTRFLPEGHAEMRNVLFAPLNIEGKTTGIIGLADKTGGFTDRDAKLARAFGDMAAIALANSRSREALESSKEKYRGYVDNAPDGIFVADQTGHYVQVNDAACRITGYAKDELLNMSISDLVPAKDRRHAYSSFRKLNQDGKSNIQGRFIHKNGDIRHWTVNAVKLSDARFLGFTKDVSDQVRAEELKKQLEDQLRQSQKMEAIGRLAGGVAHDFNNILTVIQGFSDLLLEKTTESDMRGDVLEILKASESASMLTQQLLAFSRKQIIEPKIVDLNNAIRDSKGMLRRVIGEDVELEFIPERKIHSIQFDRGQIAQILMNLVINSRDAMPGGGKVVIETLNISLDETKTSGGETIPAGDYAVLALSDTGSGINPEEMQKIFEPFFTTKSKGKGTGLGLSTVYGIVKQNNGYISVYSEIGYGTTIKIYIPAIEAQPETVSDDAQEIDLNGTENILVTEDQDFVRQLATRVLESRGYRVHQATDGVAALDIMKEKGHEIDLLITDVIMPKMSGKELYDRISETYPNLDVLYMSGYTENVIAHHGILDEGINFIEKPFRPKNFLRKVRSILNKKVQPGASETPANRIGAKSTILVIDDETSIRDTVNIFLENANFNTLIAGTGVEAMRYLKKMRRAIHLVIVDDTLPDRLGHEMLDDIRKYSPDAAIILMSGSSADDFSELLRGIARASFLPKPFRRKELLEAVSAALANED